MGGGSGSHADYPGAIEALEEMAEAERLRKRGHKCAHCGTKREDDGESCPACGSREAKQR